MDLADLLHLPSNNFGNESAPNNQLICDLENEVNSVPSVMQNFLNHPSNSESKSFPFDDLIHAPLSNNENNNYEACFDVNNVADPFQEFCGVESYFQGKQEERPVITKSIELGQNEKIDESSDDDFEPLLIPGDFPGESFKHINSNTNPRFSETAHYGQGKNLSHIPVVMSGGSESSDSMGDDDTVSQYSDDDEYQSKNKGRKRCYKKINNRKSRKEKEAPSLATVRLMGLQRHYKGRVMRLIKQAYGLRGKFIGKDFRRISSEIEKILGVKNSDWRSWWIQQCEKMTKFNMVDSMKANSEIKALIGRLKLSMTEPRMVNQSKSNKKRAVQK